MNPRQPGSGSNEGLRKKYVDAVLRAKKLLRNNIDKDVRLDAFTDIIRKKHGITIDTYQDLHKWSIENCGKFWEEVFKYFEIIHTEPYEEVLPVYKELLGIEWFRGLKFNFGENMLRYRDDHVALICLDEEGREKHITYAEMYEEVKKYAAAMRHHGFRTGDILACCMSNREEALFAMIAAASIGAVWGGIRPFYGPKANASALCAMNPKFFFVIDKFRQNQQEHNILENLHAMVKGVSSIEKIIIVPTKDESLKVDISNTPCSCCFLNEFLEPGSQDVNEFSSNLKFEQLPFNHPLSINLTSGTTGQPKALVHSAGTLLSMMKDNGLQYNLSRKDIIFNEALRGWTVWNTFTSTVALGSTLLLYCGDPFFLPHTSFWDILGKYKVTVAYNIPTSIFDKMEKLNIVPDPSCDLTNLNMIIPTGSVVKPNNFDFLHQKVKKDMFIVSAYGQTEYLGDFSGFHLNSPVYSGEIQCVALGMDLKIFDDSGIPVVREIGEVVICSPNPGFPLCLLNDESGKKLRSAYLSKFPGIWDANDEGWIDPETNGLIILGRSDEILNPQEERFSPDVIYFVIQEVKEVYDSLCVRQSSAKGFQRFVLFLKLLPEVEFTEDLIQKVSKKIKQELTECHVPEIILETKEIPYNANGKKMEKLLSKIIDMNQVPEVDICRNPKCLEFYCNIPELQNY